MRPSRMAGVEEADMGGLDAPGYYGDGVSAPGWASDTYGGGAGVGSYGDGVSAIEPVMTLASHQTPGRTARRRSMAGQLKREAEAFGRRSRRQALDGLGLTTGDVCKCPAGTPMAGQMSKYVNAGGFTGCVCGQQSALTPAFEYVGQVAVNTVNSHAGTDFKGPQDESQVVPVSTVDTRAIINARLAQGKTMSTKKSKLVPIVAGVAAVGLIAWLL